MNGFTEAIFTFLFKYRPLLFEQGELVFQSTVPASVLGGAALAAVGVAAWTYRRPLPKVSGRDRLVLGIFRTLAFLVLAFCLMRPALVLSSVLPQENYIGVLIDDSRSMRIAEGGQQRADAVLASFGDAESDLVRSLAENFQVRYFRFSDQVDRLESADELTFAGARTDLAPALNRARQELGSLPLSGLVVVTDGADAGALATGGAHSELSNALLTLRASKIPIYAVGVGRATFERDIELSRVAVPRTALKGAALVVDVTLSQTGYSGRSVSVYVEDAGRIVGQQEVALPSGGEPSVVRVQFSVTESGVRRLKFRVPAQDGELVLENNEQEAIVRVSDRAEKILYVEGEPRWEVAFLRRAVEPDSNLQLVTMVRMAESRFARLHVDSAGELLQGFPRTREELFSYRGLVLGSIEASYFSHEQLRMIADFVAERGGGLLMLGGRHAFTEGGYANTPVADALPVELDPMFSRDTLYFDTLRIALTPAGAAQAALRIAPDERQSAERWRTLPGLTTYNRIGDLKPGASMLLSAAGRRTGENRPVLAHQRFGRGQAFSFAVQDSWWWQMSPDVPLEDQTHELFWRQLLRWLVTEVPEHVVFTPASDQVATGSNVRLTAHFSDKAFLRINDGRLTARVVAPDGTEQDVPLEWTVDRDGEYRGSFTAAEPGMYEVHGVARRGTDSYEAQVSYVFAGDETSEYFGAQMNEPLLRRIASETGGRFYTMADVRTLAEDITYTGRGSTVQEEKDLWDMPVVFLLLVGFIGLEWGYRRWRGLA